MSRLALFLRRWAFVSTGSVVQQMSVPCLHLPHMPTATQPELLKNSPPISIPLLKLFTVEQLSSGSGSDFKEKPHSVLYCGHRKQLHRMHGHSLALVTSTARTRDNTMGLRWKHMPAGHVRFSIYLGSLTIALSCSLTAKTVVTFTASTRIDAARCVQKQEIARHLYPGHD